MKSICTFFFFIFVVLNLDAQVPTADALIQQAQTKAAQTNKNVFVIFHASWCYWCHKMDSAMNKPEMKPLFDNNYVITRLTVLESPDKKDLENPGGEDYLKKFHGDREGIPYWYITDKDGNLLADSRTDKPDGSKAGNIGCPAQPDEVAYFLKVLKQTSSLNEAQLEKVKVEFLKIGESF